jgi:hypothetical protein
MARADGARPTFTRKGLSMLIPAPPALRWAYVLAVLCVVFPYGLSRSGWVQMSMGGGSPIGLIPFAGPLAMLFLGLSRCYMVIRRPGTLSAYAVTGGARVLRVLGLAGVYVGGVAGALNLVGRPLITLIGTRSDNGIEYYVAGVFLSILGGLGAIGLVSFELSRLIGFESRAAAPAA